MGTKQQKKKTWYWKEFGNKNGIVNEYMHTVPFLMFLEEQKKLENPGTNNTPTNKEYSYIKKKRKKKDTGALYACDAYRTTYRYTLML